MANEYEYRVGYKCGDCGEHYFVRDGFDNSVPPSRFSKEEAEKRYFIPVTLTTAGFGSLLTVGTVDASS